MAQRRFHYEQAFEHYLRANAIPYVAVDEAKRALHDAGKPHAVPTKLKSFDFVVYAEHGRNLLIDVKGRKHSGRTGKSLQNWVTRDDVKSLRTWAGIFGDGFTPAFAFLFWCQNPPSQDKSEDWRVLLLNSGEWLPLLDALKTGQTPCNSTPQAEPSETP